MMKLVQAVNNYGFIASVKTPDYGVWCWYVVHVGIEESVVGDSTDLW